ncbi:Protein hu-li tai shao [Papilio xuthus]|uniref:Protein hu-li tai shao n=1 Tax=Papilio xuthus TaxID=66420 RepID=A0A194Q0Y5_PAPXU|nr:Protein hu-li tai shao [Papilio xuthus]
MADTDTETLPNGTGPLSTTEEEDERLKQRPADIDADVREMERRKRVEALMSSKLFREELERVLDQQAHEGSDAPLLQRIREMVGGRLHTGSLRGPSCVLPINDIRGIEGVGYEKGEKILRCKLAAVYRLVDLFGWTQTGVSGQITARLNTAVEQVLTTPRGLLPHEVTASSLVKVDMQGVVQDQGTTNFPVNVEGFSLHASVHAARPDVRCVLHVRSAAALAVSASRRGLLPLCAEAALLGPLAHHRTPHGNLDNEERDKLVRALGPSAKVLMLTSNGALCCGATLEEAFFQAKNLNTACEVQLRVANQPLDDLYLLDEETRRQIYESSRKPPADTSKWRVGGEEFEALMRMLDNAGFRTGYIYRHPLIKNDVPKPKNDVEVPPAVSSLGYLLEEEELYKQGLWKKGQGKTGERTRWLNSPNVYQKVEVLETGTSDPKKITKWVDANNEEWVQDGSPAHSSTPVKIDTLQFVPKNTNPKEFKQLQQQIKENRRADKISAGPQSHILEGVTWDEAARLVGEDAVNTHTGDHVVLMGAASKGIIQRGYQHNATMYSSPYARNPFDHVTDREIDEYKRIVERKQRGNEYDTDLSESEAVSGAQVTSPASAPSETEEESRDEHRVLRIETKQVPVRSQPELVLSDVDTTDFLKAEREHADMSRESERDPNLLSDDEVFLDSAASTGTSSITAPSTVVIRQYNAHAPLLHVGDNQTVIENKEIRNKAIEKDINVEITNTKELESDIEKTESNPEITDEGEYHSFHDEMDFEDAVYDSPVKKLVEKDIRDYSVPINFFCSDYSRNDMYQSPRKSDLQRILEPILEESKSINSDESNNFSCIDNKIIIKSENLRDDIIRVPKNILNDIKMQTDSRLSRSTLSTEGVSFDSTIEFEKLEIISDIIEVIINRIDYDYIHRKEEFNNLIEINKETEQEFETFSIIDNVKEIENNVSFNSTNDNIQIESHRIIEAIIYYIYDKSIYIATKKNKRKQKKNVVTIVDYEDILYTTTPMFLYNDINTKLNLEIDFKCNKGDVWVDYNEIDDACKIASDDDEIRNSMEAFISNKEDINVLESNDNDYTNVDDLEVNSDKTYVVKSDEIEHLHDTFNLENDEMNIGFVVNDFSRSSSPRRWNSVLDLCNESPIKNICDAENDLSLLYERNDSVLGSPFLKQAPVIAMSLTENKGGLKYWISFDDSLNDVKERSFSEHTVNGDHSDAHQSTFSHSSKEGSPSKEVSTEDSPKKDKKKKKGLRTPSFLKKKKEKKKEKSSTPQPA